MISHYILDFLKPSVPGSAAVWVWFSLVLWGAKKNSRGEYWINLKHGVKQSTFVDSKALLLCSSRKVQMIIFSVI